MTTDRRKAWRSLKQILALEKANQPFLENNSTTYSMIDAPPSAKPIKKYSDISGLPAKYRDPITTLQYASSAEYNIIKTLPSDIIAGYLALRKANNTQFG